MLYLADTSAWNRSAHVADRWAELIEDDALAMCLPVFLELLYSARTRAEYRAIADDLRKFHDLPLNRQASRAAGRTQGALAQRSQHRGPTPVDLLVAAVAEVNDAVLLHYDRHFDAIRRVTGQPMEWLARRGSLG